MTTVTLYTSSDASAPTLSGSAGALITVLDAVLVNGYGSKSAAGWTKAFSGTNKATYRMNTTDGTGFYLYVDDTGPGAGGAREARATGFQTQSALGTGTGQFPTSGQLAIGTGAIPVRKSTTADATARAWTIVADDTCFYFFAETGDQTSPTMTYPFMFGDIFSMNGTSDAYRCMIMGRNLENSASGNQDGFGYLISQATNSIMSVNLGGHYMAANAAGVGGSIICGKHADIGKMGSTAHIQAATAATATFGTSGFSTLFGGSSIGSPMGANYTAPNAPMDFPNPVDGGIYLSPLWVHHNGTVRGYLKGLWAPMHHMPFGHNDTFSGTGAMSTKSFICQYILGNFNGSVQPGEVLVETTSTWS